MKARKAFSRWWPVVVWGGFIFYLSSIPNLRTAADPSLDEVLRSLLHALFYAFFYLLWRRALRGSTKEAARAFFSAMGYAVLDEIHQYFVPTRTFQVGDLIIDLVGCLGGIWISEKFIPALPPKLTHWVKKLELA